jgi:hypothetical protein
LTSLLQVLPSLALIALHEGEEPRKRNTRCAPHLDDLVHLLFLHAGRVGTRKGEQHGVRCRGLVFQREKTSVSALENKRPFSA